MNHQHRFLGTLLRGTSQQSKRTVLVVVLALLGVAYAHAQLRVDTLVTKLHFECGSTMVDPECWDNEYQLQQMLEVLDGCADARILGVRVVGSSSPDGKLNRNAAIAERRAERAQQYLQQHYPAQFSDTLCWTDSVIAEDWDCVERNLLTSTVKDNDILAIMVLSIPYLILDEEGNVINSRKKILMDYDAGDVWRQMNEEIFPDCRAAEISVIIESSFADAFTEVPGTLTIAPRPDTYYPPATEPYVAEPKQTKPAAVKAQTNVSAKADISAKPTDKEEVKEQEIKPVVKKPVAKPATKKQVKPAINNDKERARTHEVEVIPGVDKTHPLYGLLCWLLYLPAVICILWFMVFILKAKLRVVYHPMVRVVLAVMALATALLPSYILDHSLESAKMAFLAHTSFLLVLPFIYLFARVILKKGKMAMHHYALLLCPVLLSFMEVWMVVAVELAIVGVYAIRSTILAYRKAKITNNSKEAFFHLKLMKNLSALVWVYGFYLLYVYLFHGISPYIYILIVFVLAWYIHRYAFYADLAQDDFDTIFLNADAVRIEQTPATAQSLTNTQISAPQKEAAVPVREHTMLSSDAPTSEPEPSPEPAPAPAQTPTPQPKPTPKPKPTPIVKSATPTALDVDFDRLMDEEGYYRNPSINSDLTAKKLSTNRTYLGNMIKERFNCSFSEYVAMKRVEYVKEYLSQHPEKTLAEVAQASGFASIETLCRTYKKLTGSTPKAGL